eukprot:gnl/MRDRNA2_/MRDRNA2_80574_c0_seq1.p1 gnl/MRDRNA2_/MRDRNA2_80574_c0~~gnl/MRDRNA2_/MRDRNA2_80574_c0_seq1.p1  ORF type:complete len:294 (+),score=48.80 gnl/MRDRNA2_/MRDRNA2_80574_c0_seq1:122-1003(+)
MVDEAKLQKISALKSVADRLELVAAHGVKRMREWEGAQLRPSPTLEVLTGFASRLRTDPPPAHPLALDTAMPLTEFAPRFGLPYPTNYDISQSVLGIARASPPILVRQSESEVFLRALPPSKMIIFTIDGSEPLAADTRRTHTALDGPYISQTGIRYDQASDHRGQSASIVLPVKPGSRLLARATGPGLQVSVTIAVDIQVSSAKDMGMVAVEPTAPILSQSLQASESLRPSRQVVQPQKEASSPTKTEARARFANDLLLGSDESDSDDDSRNESNGLLMMTKPKFDLHLPES